MRVLKTAGIVFVTQSVHLEEEYLKRHSLYEKFTLYRHNKTKNMKPVPAGYEKGYN